MCTTLYVKLIAPDQLLLSETVCHRLGIVNYHPHVKAMQRNLLQLSWKETARQRKRLVLISAEWNMLLPL